MVTNLWHMLRKIDTPHLHSVLAFNIRWEYHNTNSCFNTDNVQICALYALFLFIITVKHLKDWNILLLQRFASEDRLNAHCDSSHYVQHLLPMLPNGIRAVVVLNSGRVWFASWLS